MRSFIILGALSAVARGAELPITASAAARAIGYKYVASQTDSGASGVSDLEQASWGGTCASTTKQSPIDIVTSSVKEESTNPGEIMLIGHDVEMTGKLLNDGRQIYYVPTTSGKPTLYGGALSSSKSYVFDHLEFKFDTADTDGSEHAIDGKKYPMEIQLVFYDQNTFADGDDVAATGATTSDAVVVLSYFVETDGTTANTALASIITAIDTATDMTPGSGGIAGEVDDIKLTLKDLLGDIDTVDDYYYYAGSQTSSKCEENVKWIIATDMLKISTTSLGYFRLLIDANGASSFVAPNNRDLRTNSIDVMHRSSETKKSEIFEEAATILGSTLLGIGTFGTVLNLLQHDATAKALKSNPILELIEDFDKKFLNGEEEQQSHQQFQQQQFQQRY